MEETTYNSQQLTIAGKTVTIYPAAAPDKPIIYLNVFSGNGSEEYRAFRQICNEDFTLAVIGNLVWNHDMTPWAIPPISKNDTPYTGGANDYLHLLTNEIIPEVEKRIPDTVLWRGIAGYSLAGLFAVYAVYRTNIFSRVGSVSGSLWFPNFREYLFSHELEHKPDCIYFSLGNKECKTTNPFLREVQERTETIRNFYRENGIDTEFQLNSGGHFKNVSERTAAGIAWLLSKSL